MQSTNGAYKRNTSITHGDHLRESAGLVPGWHEEDIRTRIDLACELGIVTSLDPDAVRHGFLQILRLLFELGISRAQDDQLPVFPTKHFQAFERNINALGFIHASDHAK